MTQKATVRLKDRNAGSCLSAHLRILKVCSLGKNRPSMTVIRTKTSQASGLPQGTAEEEMPGMGEVAEGGGEGGAWGKAVSTRRRGGV